MQKSHERKLRSDSKVLLIDGVMVVAQRRTLEEETMKGRTVEEMLGWFSGRALGRTLRFICEKETKENMQDNCKLSWKKNCLDL